MTAKLQIRLSLTTAEADILQDTLQIGADHRLNRYLRDDSELILSIFKLARTKASISRAKQHDKRRRAKQAKERKI